METIFPYRIFFSTTVLLPKLPKATKVVRSRMLYLILLHTVVLRL
jgi:hypothetical protein